MEILTLTLLFYRRALPNCTSALFNMIIKSIELLALFSVILQNLFIKQKGLLL